MAADALLVIAELADNLLREGAFNALMTVIAATLASVKKSREEAMAEQENRAQYYTAIGWLCEYASILVPTPTCPTWLLSAFEEVLDASLFIAIGKWIAAQVEARQWHILSPALSALKGMLLFGLALYFDAPAESESRLVGKGFLMNVVYDPDHFLDLLVDLHHRVGTARTTRRFGVLVMELIDLTIDLMERWADGPLYSLGKKRATATVANDGPEKEQNTSEEEDEENDQIRKEIPIDNVKYLRRFVSSDTIAHYLFFLSNYTTNPTWLNAVVLRFFDRIVKEGLVRMFHEARTILVVQRILSDASIKGLEVHKPLLRWANEVVNDLRALLARNPFLYVELLFPRNARSLFQLDGDAAPTRRIVMVPVDPFEKESLVSLFAKVGLDKTDMLLLGDEASMTLKSLVEMPDVEIKKLPFTLEKIDALIGKLGPFRDWLTEEKEREAKRKEREERRREREEREKWEQDLALERAARGDDDSSDGGVLMGDEDSDTLRRKIRAKERELQKEKEQTPKDSMLDIDDTDIPAGGGRNRVIDDEEKEVESTKASFSKEKSRDKAKKEESSKDKEASEKQRKKEARQKQKQREKKSAKEKVKGRETEKNESETGEEDKEKEANGDSNKGSKKTEKIHKRDPTEEKEEMRKRKSSALDDLRKKKGLAPIPVPSPHPSASSATSSATVADQPTSVSIPDPSSHLSVPLLTPAPPVTDSGDAASVPLQRKRFRKSTDEPDEDDLALPEDTAPAPASGRKAARVLEDDE